MILLGKLQENISFLKLYFSDGEVSTAIKLEGGGGGLRP